MKLYLSSYKLGIATDVLKDWIAQSGDNKIVFIANAGDGYGSTDEERAPRTAAYCKLLEDLGFIVTPLDLRRFFGKEKELAEFLKDYRAFFTAGGNTFVLRQAMKLSGFDNYLLSKVNEQGYLYGGWSAGICLLYKDLKTLQQVDDPTSNPYNYPTVWDGLGILDYMPMPHYRSDHNESALIDKEIEYAQKHKVPYKTMHDGDVIVRDTITGEEKLYPITVGIGIIVQDKQGRVLLGRHTTEYQQKKDKFYDNWQWSTPGGKIDPGETFEDCAIRETKEETNLDIKNPRILTIRNHKSKTGTWTGVIMHTTQYSGTPKTMEPDKHAEWRWFKLDELPDGILPPREEILETLKGAP